MNGREILDLYEKWTTDEENITYEAYNPFEFYFDLELSVDYYRHQKMTNKFNHPGVYLLYDENMELLYVGWAQKLSTRLAEHLSGWSHRFYKEIKHIKIFSIFTFSEFHRIYGDKLGSVESYCIYYMHPKYNRNKNMKPQYRFEKEGDRNIIYLV